MNLWPRGFSQINSLYILPSIYHMILNRGTVTSWQTSWEGIVIGEYLWSIGCPKFPLRGLPLQSLNKGAQFYCSRRIQATGVSAGTNRKRLLTELNWNLWAALQTWSFNCHTGWSALKSQNQVGASLIAIMPCLSNPRRWVTWPIDWELGRNKRMTFHHAAPMCRRPQFPVRLY